MGNGGTKEGIIQRLDELDVEELKINIKLKKLQSKLNEMVPEEERMEVNHQLLFNRICLNINILPYIQISLSIKINMCQI